MDQDISIVIEPANDWESYSNAWSSAMKHLYWYQENPIFDFHKDEEMDEMRLDFQAPGNLFLIARLKNQDGIVGVLGFRYQEYVARLRRWEPAVIPEFQNTSVTKDLLERAIEYLNSMGVKRVNYLIKHPVDSPDCAKRHMTLFEENGFTRARPDSVDMTMPLDNLKGQSEPPLGVRVETGENYTFEDLASITVKSFTSTPEEREIHGFDKTVTEHIQATALLQRMAEGFYGYSPDEFRIIAVVDEVPAGFIGAFVIKSNHQPLTGVLGPMAVLPPYRRKGIALYLVNEILHTLNEYGCEYTAVGTPSANIGAIKLYEKAGFNLACRIISLERSL